MSKMIFTCGRCSAQFFRSTNMGRPPLYCPKCKPIAAREKTADRQRRFRRYHDQRYREEKARAAIIARINAIKKL